MAETDALKEAKELADEILRLTKSIIITGAPGNEEQETEDFVFLMDEREPLIEQLSDLRNTIDENAINSKEYAEIAEVIAQVTVLDKKHIAIMQELHKGTQKSYKAVKLGQRITAGYNPLPGNEVSGKFDVMQ
ncbi:MAG: hypothetical protein FWF79_07525 [Defluviitaleaceae bacterium]|nr:hypothetical protein [Defluviitaleaceae bacterium]